MAMEKRTLNAEPSWAQAFDFDEMEGQEDVCEECGEVMRVYKRLEFAPGFTKVVPCSLECSCQKQPSPAVHGPGLPKLAADGRIADLGGHGGFNAGTPDFPANAAFEAWEHSYREDYPRLLSEGCGAVLSGPRASGKTVVLKRLFEFFAGLGKKCVYIRHRDLLDLYYGSMGAGRQISAAEVTRLLFSAKAIAVDDFGNRKMSEWACERTAEVVALAFDNRIPLFIGTELTYEGFERVLSSSVLGSEGVLQRLKSCADFVVARD